MASQAADFLNLVCEDQFGIGRKRIGQVFNYLQALHEHRNPAKRQVDEQPWRLWLDSLPEHPTVVRHEFPDDKEDEPLDSANEKPEPHSILSVERPKLSNAPPPPKELRRWLKSGWENPEGACDHVAQVEQTDETGRARTVGFGEELTRVALFDEWAAKWKAWRLSELPARKAMRVFEQFYELHGQIEREAERYELVVGDGLLSWRLPDGGVYHPVLIRRVQLEFDAHIPRFRVVDLDKPTELYTALFSAVPDVDGQSLARCQKEFQEGDQHPLAKDANAFLKRFAITLSSHGSFLDEGQIPPDSEYPTIGRAPVLFLRSRAQSFARAIEQLLSRLETRTDFCSGLLNVVGIEGASTDELPEDHPHTFASNRLLRRDILFSKKSNRQQEEIVLRLERHKAVLVQGPPGTGKSHTIANLIGHLLAQGKSVLVTSHTTKALRVLRGHVVDQLRPLCVSVLESDSDSRDQLRESVQGISTRLSQADHGRLVREAEQLDAERNKLIDKLERARSELQNAVEGEYRSIVVAGKEFSPSEAAKNVAAGTGIHDWIPGPVALGRPMPLSINEVHEVYATNSATSTDDDNYIDVELPPLNELPKSEAFSAWVAGSTAVHNALSERELDGTRFWGSRQYKRTDIERFNRLTKRFKELVLEASHFETWRLAAVDYGRSEASRAPWNELLEKISETKSCAEIAEHDRLKFAPAFSDSTGWDEQRRVLSEICRYLQSGGRLNRFTLAIRPAWRNAIKTWQVQQHRPSQIEHFQALMNALDVEIGRGQLETFWDGLIGKRGGKVIAEVGEAPERFCAQHAEEIRRLLNWWQLEVQPTIEELKDCGFDWEQFLSRQDPCEGEHGELLRVICCIRDRLLSLLEFQVCRIDAAYGKLVLGEMCRKFGNINRPEVHSLCSAIQAGDAEAYGAAFCAIRDATKRRQIAKRRQCLLSALKQSSVECESIAGAWADQIRFRSGVHGLPKPPGDPVAAWEWRQLNDELDRRAMADVEQMGNEIDRLTSQLEEITVELIDRRAWAAQLERTNLRQRQSLIGWLQAVRKIGAGFGKRTAQLRHAAQQMMIDCQDAVPVWIMPLSRVVDNFDFSKSNFDVVIIDEASQCDAMALLVLGIARSVVIVGDHEQVSPLAVGQDVNTVNNLIAMHLGGIPAADLYDGKQSIYDIAQRSFGGVTRLVEHFRCVPDIIQFSNHLSYNGEIQSLRDETSSPLVPHVVPYRVQSMRRQDDVNSEEATAIASLIAAAIEHPAYSNQTIGAITLLGEHQAFEIQRLLVKHLEPDEVERRRLLCGNPAQFQGDERDVIFLSVVDVPGDSPLPIRQQDLFKQRFNVAASRARNQMWVVYSVDPKSDLQQGDLRRRLIEHALDPESIEKQLDRVELRVESEFERLVARRLIERHFHVIPQWKVGKYRIDLVVQDGMGSRNCLAIECDGDRFHPIDKLADDLERQAILERLGWRFLRLRGSEFFRDPDATMKRVFDKLDVMRVHPNCEGIESAQTSEGTTSDVTGELIRRASELRELWRMERPIDTA